jgi:crossover junction endodeoxyribonuclease RusA
LTKVSGSIKLPWPPSVNHYWRSIAIRGSVRVLISAQGTEYRQEVSYLVPRMDPIETDLICEIFAHPPNRLRRDLDNLLKAPLDALQHAGVYKDDSQIKKLSIEMRDVVKGGKLLVFLRELNQS